ncbi:MAG TPA: hypothetical protein VG246_06850 [Acidimicrobiales bacterium]|nr:hypothetical protein [Acidimicrobiales bacterium]
MDQNESHAPLVHQIWFSSSSDPNGLAAGSQQIVKLVGEERYRLWTLGLAREFLVDHFEDAVVSAFDRLKPLAYKADLTRYCVVQQLGGFYLDQSVSDVKLPNTESFDFIGFCDPNAEFSSWKVANNYFFARAGSPILQDSIHEVVEHCERRYYGKDPHFPTGPSVLGRSVAKLGPELNVMIGQYIWLQRRRNKYVLPHHGVVGRGKVGGKYQGGISGIPGGNNYNELWRNRDVYE